MNLHITISVFTGIFFGISGNLRPLLLGVHPAVRASRISSNFLISYKIHDIHIFVKRNNKKYL